jgi:hypothetical protein
LPDAFARGQTPYDKGSAPALSREIAFGTSWDLTQDETGAPGYFFLSPDMLETIREQL